MISRITSANPDDMQQNSVINVRTTLLVLKYILR